MPEVVAELFDYEGEMPRLQAGNLDQGPDFVAEGFGRRWFFHLKQSSSPGVVAAVGEQFHRSHPDAIEVLVVPYMTSAGRKAADKYGLNWIDLSGNAHVRDDRLYIFVRGRPNQLVQRGRPSSPFAPKSSRISRIMLLEPQRWWRRKDLASATGLDSGQVSRVVRRLLKDRLLEERENQLRPFDPDALLDAWKDEYRFDRHEVLLGHVSGAGVELSREIEKRLEEIGRPHAFTGLAAAWALDGFARFRLNSVYVEGDPYVIAEEIGLRLNERGANVQLIAPNDVGVFAGAREAEGISCVSPVQAYLDLNHLPERAKEAAESLRERGLWNAT
ncbi:MAG TPA: type IV toxin-antitoxin system AbiEi family antitoxin [Solirubrobacterales bacterium]